MQQTVLLVRAAAVRNTCTCIYLVEYILADTVVMCVGLYVLMISDRYDNETQAPRVRTAGNQKEKPRYKLTNTTGPQCKNVDRYKTVSTDQERI